MAGLRQAHIALYLHTGTAYEQLDEIGISHFLEHMMFRGCQRYPSSAALATAFEELGGMLEATTAADHGTLAIHLPAVNVLAAIWRIANVASSPLYLELETERDIIREEIQEGLSDEGTCIDGATLLRSAAFKPGALGEPITGSLEAIQIFDEGLLRQHHKRTYLPQNMVMTVAGDFAMSAATEAIIGAFGSLEGTSPPALLEANCNAGPYFQAVQQTGSGQSALHIGFVIGGRHHQDEPVIEMLLRVLDDGMSTRLYRQLCDRSGLCYDASATYETFDSLGLIEFEASTSHERVPKVLQTLFSLLSEFTTHGPTAEEFERTRKRTQWQYESIVDSPAEVADFIAHSSLKNTTSPPQLRLEALLKVEAKDLQRVALEIFRPSNRFVIIVGSAPQAALTEAKMLSLNSTEHQRPKI